MTPQKEGVSDANWRSS